MEDADHTADPTWPERIAHFFLLSAVSLLLLGRGWLTWRWNSPIRELIWQEKWWTPVLAKFEVTWAHFARTSDSWITPTLKWTGIFLMVTAFVPWIASASRLRWTRWLLLPAFLILVLDAFMRWYEKDQAGMAMEYGLRVIAPLALLIFLGRRTVLAAIRRGLVTWLLLLATALTFTGHGLYAMGYYDIPLSFQMMTMEILPLSQEASLIFLKIAGWLDFVVVALLFLPATRRPALIYMTLWGGATTAARIWAYYDPTLPWNGLDPYLAESLVRMVHWLVPLALILMLRKTRDHDPDAEPEVG